MLFRSETETTDHSVENMDVESESESESDQECLTTFIQEEMSRMPTKYLSKRQRRNVRRCLHEIVQNYQTERAYISSVPRQVKYKPAPRKPGPWRVIEVFTWTAMVTIVAGELKDWEAYEPITLPRYNLLIKADQDKAMRVLEEHDIDFTMVAWPCTPWSIMQNLNQKNQLCVRKIKTNNKTNMQPIKQTK